jgi:hypothetical protein
VTSDTEYEALKHPLPELPIPSEAKAKGWKYQVDWFENENHCYYRALSFTEARAWVDEISKNHDYIIREMPHD